MIQAELGIHVLQLSVFIFELFQPLDLRDLHATVLGSPVVERGIAHTVFAAHVFD